MRRLNPWRPRALAGSTRQPRPQTPPEGLGKRPIEFEPPAMRSNVISRVIGHKGDSVFVAQLAPLIQKAVELEAQRRSSALLPLIKTFPHMA